MNGMSSITGKPLAGVEHLHQSITDILSTRIGTRVMRRDYGSHIPALIDRPITPSLAMEIYGATAQSLEKWEPRFKLVRIQVLDAALGWVSLYVEGVYLPEQIQIVIDPLYVSAR